MGARAGTHLRGVGTCTGGARRGPVARLRRITLLSLGLWSVSEAEGEQLPLSPAAASLSSLAVAPSLASVPPPASTVPPAFVQPLACVHVGAGLGGVVGPSGFDRRGGVASLSDVARGACALLPH